MATNEFESISLPGIGGVLNGDAVLPAVVFVHGWGGCSLVWRSTLRRLATRHRMVSLDLPGTGGTPMLEPCTVDAMAQWVLDSVSRLGIDKFALVGHSMGGNIAAHAACVAPNELATLRSSTRRSLDKITSSNMYLAPRSGPAMMTLARSFCRLLKLAAAVFPDREKGDFMRPWMRRCGYVWSKNQATHMITQLRALVASPFDPAELPLSSPVLIVQGVRDPVVPLAHARLIHSSLSERASESESNVQIEMMSGFHVPMDDHPDEFAQALDAFLGA